MCAPGTLRAIGVRRVSKTASLVGGGPGARGARMAQRDERRIAGRFAMNLVVWLPGMFLLGVVSMGLCYAFLCACEKI